MLLGSHALQPQPSAAASTVTVAVHVTLGGAPLPGVFVALVPAGAETTGEFGGVTAKDGILSIASVAPGNYRVSAPSPGLTLGQSVITITAEAAGARSMQVDRIVTATLELTRTGSRLAALDASGAIARFSSASATPVAESVTVAGENFRDVRAGCASGTVWAGGYMNSGTGLFKSSDGGATFAQLNTLAWTTDTVFSPGISNTLRTIETLAVDANDNNTDIAVLKDGDVIATNDGGATCFVISDATRARGRRFGGARTGDVEIPPASTRALTARKTRADSDASNAMFGSSAGLFTTLVSWSSSVGGNTGGGSGFRTFLPLAQRQ